MTKTPTATFDLSARTPATDLAAGILKRHTTELRNGAHALEMSLEKMKLLKEYASTDGKIAPRTAVVLGAVTFSDLKDEELAVLRLRRAMQIAEIARDFQTSIPSPEVLQDSILSKELRATLAAVSRLVEATEAPREIMKKPSTLKKMVARAREGAERILKRLSELRQDAPEQKQNPQ